MAFDQWHSDGCYAVRHLKSSTRWKALLFEGTSPSAFGDLLGNLAYVVYVDLAVVSGCIHIQGFSAPTCAQKPILKFKKAKGCQN